RDDRQRKRWIGFLAGEPERRVGAGDCLQPAQIERRLNVPAVREERARDDFRIRTGARGLVVVDVALSEPVEPRAAPDAVLAPDESPLRVAIQEHAATIHVRGELLT